MLLYYISAILAIKLIGGQDREGLPAGLGEIFNALTYWLELTYINELVNTFCNL